MRSDAEPRACSGCSGARVLQHTPRMAVFETQRVHFRPSSGFLGLTYYTSTQAVRILKRVETLSCS